ncbi:hypothetical protein PoB_003299500 [Plakobranchus ocellatus]|uniref:Uncharacterized protein n=1 Tax=Plakobranchus ocellatus TaxID=259542 RepID=A0AAV4AE97_9GAST|nr:hypothetical protein PoB_003299500 [Plakobranchus ocellatus]
MNQPQKDRKRKMDALISGDNSKAHASQDSCCSSAKTPCMAAQGSASGDSQLSTHTGTMRHEFVTVLRDLEHEGSPSLIHTHACELEDVWSYRYPLPLSRIKTKPIKTGYSQRPIRNDHSSTGCSRRDRTAGDGVSACGHKTPFGKEKKEVVSDMENKLCLFVCFVEHLAHSSHLNPIGTEDGQGGEAVADEILIHKRLQHQHIVSLFNTILYQGK